MTNDENNLQGQLYLLGSRGYSAYEIAVQQGFVGTEDEWLASLVGPQGEPGTPFGDLTEAQKEELRGAQGKSAYEVSVDNGFVGSESDWVNSFLTPDGYYNKTSVDLKLDEKPYYFKNVDDMKAYNLKDGNLVITNGFYEEKDNGAAEYFIVDDNLTADNASIIELNNGLYATLIIKNNTINPIQFGAKGNLTDDDSLAIQKTILFAKENHIDYIDGLNKSYLVSDAIELPQTISDAGEKGLYIDFGVTFENFKFKLKNGASNLTTVLNIANPHSTLCILNNIEIDGNSANQQATTSVQNGGLHGIRIGFPLTNSFGGIIVKNSYIHDCYTDGLIIRAREFDSCIIDNCIVEKAGRNGITDNAISSLVENCKLINNGTRQNPKSGYHIEPDNGRNFKVKTLRNCYINGSVENGICIYLNDNEHTFEKFNIINCEADNFYLTGIANDTNPSIIKNVNIENSKFTSKGCYTRKTEHPSNFEFGNVNINNCEFLYSPQFAGSSSSNIATTNISNLTIKNSIFPESHINLQYAFNKVIIEECDFKRAEAPSENVPASNVFNIAYSDDGTVYPINYLIISKCTFYNYGRVIDNANYSTNVRPGKNISNLIMNNNFYYTSGDTGIFIKNSKTITNGIMNNNILDVENGSNYKYQLGTCTSFIGVNNINNFVSGQGFELTNVATSVIDNNIFET